MSGLTPEILAIRLAGTNPEPIGKPGGPGVWGTGKQYPSLFQHVRNDLMAKGTPEAKAHQLAWGILRNWAEGHDGGGNKVSAATQAEAVKAMAQMKQLQAQAHAKRSAIMSTDLTHDADGLDNTWDDLSDLPDLSGIGTAELDSAAQTDPEHQTWNAAGDVQRAKLGTGSRFAALKSKLTQQGAKDPGALAAKIGKAKYGKAKFAALAAKAKGGAGPYTTPPAARAGISAGELFRFWPLEECRILSRSDGSEFGSGRVVEAYAAVYGQPAQISDHQGHYEEDIAQTAFDDTLRVIHPQNNGGFWRATCLYNHGMTVHGTPAERFSVPVGVPKHISSEGKGLLTRTEYAATPLGDELLELVNIGALRSQSFTGGIIRSNPQLRGPGDRYRRLASGALQRVTRMALGLREFGLTPFAAYSGAEVLGVRMQLPGGLLDEEDYWENPGDAAAPTTDGGGPGGSPEDESASRSTGNRLYKLRTQELLEQHGITLG
jgi:phage head maturation protease